MPHRYRVNYTLRAATELQRIFDYIQRDSPQNARKMIARLIDAVQSLEILPNRYRVPRNANLLGREIRSMPLRSYLIRFHVNESATTVTVLSVRHGARRPEI